MHIHVGTGNVARTYFSNSANSECWVCSRNVWLWHRFFHVVLNLKLVMPSHPLCCSSLALQRGPFLSCLILGLVEESQAALILKPEERYKSCHTPFYDVVGVILSLVEHEGSHVKLELGLAPLYQGRGFVPSRHSQSAAGAVCELVYEVPFPCADSRPPGSRRAWEGARGGGDGALAGSPSLPSQPGSVHGDREEGTRVGLRGPRVPPAEQGQGRTSLQRLVPAVCEPAARQALAGTCLLPLGTTPPAPPGRLFKV